MPIAQPCFRVRPSPIEHGLFAISPSQTRNHTIGPSQATPSLLIAVVLSPRTDIWGAVTNTSYDGLPTSLGIHILVHADANPLSQTRICGRQATYVHPNVLEGLGICSFALVALLKRATKVNHSCCSLKKEGWKKSNERDFLLLLF